MRLKTWAEQSFCELEEQARHSVFLMFWETNGVSGLSRQSKRGAKFLEENKVHINVTTVTMVFPLQHFLNVS